MHRLLLAALLIPFAASAVPLEFSHQGRLLDATGAPLDGSFDLTFAIYDSPAGTGSAWTSTRTLDLDNGYYSVDLGTGASLDVADFDGQALWLGIAVGANPELSRVPLASVPYAIRAQDATNVSGGGIVNASQIQINGTTVLDSTGITGGVDWADVSGTPSVLGDLGCTADQLAIVGSSGWSCIDESALSVDAGLLTGFVDINRLPMGTGATNAAYGNHTHTSVTGTVQIGDTADLCDASGQYGTLRWNTDDEMHVCTPSGWVPLYQQICGEIQADAGATCADLLTSCPTQPNGNYWIDPNGGATSDAFQVECDMTGGGWTKLVPEFKSYSWRNSICGSPTDGDCKPNPISGHTPYQQYGAGINGVINYEDATGAQVDVGQLAALGLLVTEANTNVEVWTYDIEPTCASNYVATLNYYGGVQRTGPSADFCNNPTVDGQWTEITTTLPSAYLDSGFIEFVDLTATSNWGWFHHFLNNEIWVR